MVLNVPVGDGLKIEDDWQILSWKSKPLGGRSTAFKSSKYGLSIDLFSREIWDQVLSPASKLHAVSSE
jgi:hypothetical protein